MAEVIFIYEGIETAIQCNINDKIEEIINKFLLKINISGKNSNLIYLYNGESIRKELTFQEQANELDKERNKMNVLVNQINEDKIKKNEIISKDIICPFCEENIFINFDNFKIRLHGCKNNHDINDILLTKYEKSQKIDLSKIIYVNYVTRMIKVLHIIMIFIYAIHVIKIYVPYANHPTI